MSDDLATDDLSPGQWSLTDPGAGAPIRTGSCSGVYVVEPGLALGVIHAIVVSSRAAITRRRLEIHPMVRLPGPEAHHDLVWRRRVVAMTPPDR
jgi:hypothetical protein